jgi:DNA invertase Pin-like site-specific DNA recombinase/flagellar biosynthesis chaperone FliJ
MPYCIYLRKSRADIEAEQHGEGETLARHEKILTDLSCRLRLCVTQIYREVVSGETIEARPVMQRLLREVEQGMWEGVIVVEVERLARGDTMDQGQVAKSFKFNNTKIVTPSKTYDPGNEFDEEYFEFGLFMSRREYKTINRRLQRGRLSSAKEGKVINSSAPYGYRKIKIHNDKGFTLEVIPEEAAVVKMIFDLYVNGNQNLDGSTSKMGMPLICKKLDSLGIKPRINDTWSVATIRDMLKNPTYIGKLRWQWKKEVKRYEDGMLKKTRTKSKECLMFDGIHQPIINEDTFFLAQNMLKKNRTSTTASTQLQNPLTGIIYCKKCKRLMTRMAKNKKTPYDTMKCPNINCDNISAPLYLIEQELIKALHEWVKDFRFRWGVDVVKNYDNEISVLNTAIKQANDELTSLRTQYNKTFELLEKGIYTTEIFMQRNTALNQQIGEIQDNLIDLTFQLEREKKRTEARVEIVPKLEKMLEVYYELDVNEKNYYLKDVLEKVEYVKYERNSRTKRDVANFELKLFPFIH